MLDKKTGLMWNQYAEGLIGTGCTDGYERHVYWDKALILGNNSKFAGYKDWRLPNVKELASLVERKCSSPAINLAVFTNTPSDDFWSSSPNENYDVASRTISFDTGAGDYFGGWRNDSYAVRLVRGGQ